MKRSAFVPSVVVDTSIAIKWAMKEHDSSTAVALLRKWTGEKLLILAPPLLAYEATNALYRHVRKGNLTLGDAKYGLREVLLKAVNIDFSQNFELNARAMELASHFGLAAAYDAHYLALAEREACELWTADERLWNAVRGRLGWVRWMGDYEENS